MNTFTSSNRLAARFVAVLAVFSLLMSMVPVQVFAMQPENPGNGGGPEDLIDYCHVPSGDLDKIKLYEGQPASSWSGHDGGDNGHELDFLIENDSDMQRCLDLINPPTYQCNDAIDNDGDGSVDFPADLGCASATDSDEAGPDPVYQCNDAIDNDGDGSVDFPADLGCASATDDDENNLPTDTDEDTIPDDVDNCPLVANLDQLDRDEDMIGDACEAPDPVCEDDGALNYGEAGECVYEDGPEPVVCINPEQNLLVNGSFEEKSIGGDGTWTIEESVPGWNILLSSGLEIWHNLFGTASDGNQNAELDGEDATKITQSVVTEPGAVYLLRFDFAPRPETGLVQNNLDVLVDDALFMNVSGDGTSIPSLTDDVWTTYSDTFVASGASTVIGFEDKGEPDSGSAGLGTLLDNAVLCLVEEPEEEEEPTQCVPDLNLIKNGNFETPVVENEAGWDVFDSVVDGLEWVVTWLNPVEGAPEVATLELQTFLTASAGEQFAELDSNYTHPGELPKVLGDARVKIAQTIATVPGKEYTLTFDFSAIPWGKSIKNNIVNVRVDGVIVYTASTSLPAEATDTDWSTHTVSFVATDSETVVSLEDGATTEPQMTNTDGTLIDNVSLVCNPDDDGGGDNDKDTYEIFGFVWDDTDEDDEREEGEDNLEGWTVRAVNTETDEVRETTTDENGRYEFNVPAGTWKISEETEAGWVLLSEADGDGTYTVTVPAPLVTMEEDESVFAAVMGYIVPTAHAVVFDPAPVSYGAFNFGNDYEGRSSGGRSGSRRTGGTVAGDSTSLPEGTVLGEATSTMPVGAPNTGAGGASHGAPVVPTLSAILSAGLAVRKSK